MVQVCCTQQSPIAFESESPTRPPQTDHRHGNYQSLFLFEIGGGKNYSREQELDIQIKKIGHDISYGNGSMGNLHLDQAEKLQRHSGSHIRSRRRNEAHILFCRNEI
jgi:hypothetical protein